MIAQQLGFKPNLYSAQNVNDNAVRLVNEGLLSFGGGKVVETFSNAMDCRNSYNVERLLYLVSDGQTVKKLMGRVESLEGNLKGIKLEGDLNEKIGRVVKGAMTVDTETTLKAIGDCWNANKYLICPHTATAVAFVHWNFKQKNKSGNKAYVIATASPEKFPEAVEKAGVKTGSESESKFLEILRAKERKEPKLMKRGEDWYTILEEEIKNIRESNKI